MAFISDVLLIAGALGVGFYCFVLSRRLSTFTDLEKGVGGAVAVLSGQVDDLTRALAAAREAAGGSGDRLEALTTRADDVARRLELHVAALHDLPERPAPEPAPAVFSHGRAVSPSPDASGAAPEATDGDVPDPAPMAPAEPPAPEPEAQPVNLAAPPVQSFFASHRRPAAGMAR
jgi:hypothetical protein